MGRIQANGRGITTLLEGYINNSLIDADLVEVELLCELNKVVNPEINFKRIFVQKSSNVDSWEVYFEDNSGVKIALSKMGSGIKTILQVLVNLLVISKSTYTTRKKVIYAFEELENNLHPSMQRKIMKYIQEFSKRHPDDTFFITTHSSTVINSFASSENVQYIHVQNEEGIAITSTITEVHKIEEILDDLGVKASDLLQTNGVIWVEGPSDRNYLKRWLELIAPELEEGLHFTIMFYGGDLRSSISFDDNWLDSHLIPLFKINRNSFVMMDRDGTSNEAKINNSKKRIIEELGEFSTWVTGGREIENYLSNKTVNSWINGKNKMNDSKFTNEPNTKIEDSIGKVSNLKYARNKTKFSRELVNHIQENDLEILDLKEKLNSLIQNIGKWNE